MAHATRTDLIKRDTAILASGLVKQPARSLISPDVPTGAYLLNFDPNAPEAPELLYLSEEGATREALQHLEVPFLMKWWVLKKIELPDMESGEMQSLVRSVFISPDKETLSFVSVGIIGSLDLLRHLKGDGPYDPPIPVLVKLERTRAGFNLFRIRPQFDHESKGVSKK